VLRATDRARLTAGHRQVNLSSDSGGPSDRTHYFTGRSDNFDPTRPSSDRADARLDPESIRVSNDGERVYISDEYGPSVYEFDRRTGKRTRSSRSCT